MMPIRWRVSPRRTRRLDKEAGLMQRNWGVGRAFVGTGVVLLMAGCSATSDPGFDGAETVTQAVKVTTIDVRRSLAVTEQTILSRFSLQRVLTQLATQSAVPGLTATALFQQ